MKIITTYNVSNGQHHARSKIFDHLMQQFEERLCLYNLSVRSDKYINTQL